MVSLRDYGITPNGLIFFRQWVVLYTDSSRPQRPANKESGVA